MSVQWPEHFASEVVGVSNGSSALSSVCIALEAWRRGLKVTFSRADLQNYSISSDEKTIDFNYSRPQSITRKEDHAKLDRKAETLAVLRENDVPTPQGVRLDPRDTTTEILKEEAQQLGYPLVLKPEKGSFGRGVMTGLEDWDELESAYAHLLSDLNSSHVLLEKHHKGDDYRLLVVGDRVVGAVHRVPANVTGDGENSISDLIARKNSERRKNPFLAGGLIKVDFEVRKCLADQNLSLDSVPSEGQYVTLRRVANASAGGDVVDVTDKIPDQMKEAAVRAVHSVPRIVIAGVDILYDPNAGDDNYVVIEMNSRPHIGVNMYPSTGEGRDAPRAVIDALFPNTIRRESQGLRNIRFNTTAVISSIRSGITSEVVLPPLPSHLYPYRKRLRYSLGTDKKTKGRVPQGALLRLAHENNLVGNFKRTGNGGVEVTIAGRNESSARPLIRRISDWIGSEPISESPWRGIVSTTFLISN